MDGMSQEIKLQASNITKLEKELGESRAQTQPVLQNVTNNQNRTEGKLDELQKNITQKVTYLLKFTFK
mgnify:CR=1 FL=1